MRYPDSDSDSRVLCFRSPSCRLFARSLSLVSLIGLILLCTRPAVAETLTPVKLRIGGQEFAGKTTPICDGKETYVPLETLALVGATGKVAAKGDAVVVTLPTTHKRQELALARVKGKPMLALSDLARLLNAEVRQPDAVGKDGKPEVGKRGDTVYLLAYVTDARFVEGTLRVTTSFPVPYRVRTLAENLPVRSFMDCLGATLADGLKPVLPEGEKRITRLRAGQNTIEVARIVVEMENGNALKACDSVANSQPHIVAGLDTIPMVVAKAGNPAKPPLRIAENRTQASGKIGSGADNKSKSKIPTPDTQRHPTDTDTASSQHLEPDIDSGNPLEPDSVKGTGSVQVKPNPAQAGAIPTPNRGGAASRGAKPKREMPPVEVRAVNFITVDENRFRVDIATSGKAGANVRYLQDANQMVVDVPNARLNLDDPSQSEQTLNHPLVAGLKAEMAQDMPPVMRVTLDMTRIVGFSVNADDNRVSLEMRLPRNATGALADKVIVVDAGHGGSSSGATGGSIYEKNCTLAIALKLRAALEACGARVVMTRDRDVDVALYDRPRLANNVGADLFISVHNDSNGTPNSASGTSTYYHMSDPSSRALAACVQHAVMQVTGLPSRGVLSDGVMYANGFAVLRASNMPAVLCEVAYINNAKDRRKLIDPDFQQRVAQAMCDGLRAYVEGAPTSFRRKPSRDQDTKPDGDEMPMPDPDNPKQENP